MVGRYPPIDQPPRTVSGIHEPEPAGREEVVRSSSVVGSQELEWAPGLRVRPALEADIEAIEALERASFSDPWSAESFLTSLDRPEVHMTVAEWRDEDMKAKIVGYMVSWFLGEEGEIANIAVAGSWQRRGVGAALLDEVLAAGRASGVESIYLEVRASNAAAQALYAGRGFHSIGKRRRYYLDPPEDALVMKWESDPAPACIGAS